jgi:hypothetical protein
VIVGISSFVVVAGVVMEAMLDMEVTRGDVWCVTS